MHSDSIAALNVGDIMKKLCITLALLVGAITTTHAEELKVGIVNFQTCVMESQFGKREQEQLQTIKEQMESLVKDLDKKLADVGEKLGDPDYLDTLSPEGEAELKSEFQMGQEEMQRYQGQYYQVMQQSQARLHQVMAHHIAQASEKVAEANKLSHVIHRDVCFYSSSSFDVTDQIIETMDKAFEEEEKSANVTQAENKE